MGLTVPISLYVQDCLQAAYWGRPVSLSEDM